MNYVTDTHSLVWYFTDDQRLGKTQNTTLKTSFYESER